LNKEEPYMNTTAATLVAEAVAHVYPLHATDFAQRVDLGDSVLIDLREADERVRFGSIRGAIHIPRGMLEFRADHSDEGFDERLVRWPRVLLYCSDGGRSALAATTMAMLGYRDVAHLDGGLLAWSHANLPVYGAQIDPYCA
jgi:rhodanese-related sulfurtransferase